MQLQQTLTEYAVDARKLSHFPLGIIDTWTDDWVRSKIKPFSKLISDQSRGFQQIKSALPFV